MAITFFAASTSAFEREPREKRSVKGTVYVWKDGSGMESGKTKWYDDMKPAAGIKLYVRSQIDGYIGKMPIVDSLVSDANGNFSLELYEGKYQFIEPWKAKAFAVPNDGVDRDTACYREQYNQYELQIQVNGEMDSVAVPLFNSKAEYDPCIRRK